MFIQNKKTQEKFQIISKSNISQKKLYSTNSITETRIMNELERLRNEKKWIELRKHIDYIKALYPKLKIKNIDQLRNEALTNIVKIANS